MWCGSVSRGSEVEVDAELVADVVVEDFKLLLDHRGTAVASHELRSAQVEHGGDVEGQVLRYVGGALEVSQQVLVVGVAADEAILANLRD